MLEHRKESAATTPLISSFSQAGLLLGITAIGGEIHVFFGGGPNPGAGTTVVKNHDLGFGDPGRILWSDTGSSAMDGIVAGTVLPKIQEAIRDRKPALIVIHSTALSGAVDERLAGLLSQLESELSCPVLLVPAASEGDLWSGYGSVVRAAVSKICWEKEVAERHTASLIGFFFHRREMDQQANLVELRRLLEALGVHMGPALLGGDPWSMTANAFRSDILLRLPSAGISAEELKGLTGRTILDCALPFGIAATRNWLTRIADELALDPKLIEGLIRREEKQAKHRMDMARTVLQERRVAIVGDVAQAAGWTSLCLELGMKPDLVVLLGNSMGEGNAYARLLAQADQTLPEDSQLVIDPPVEALNALLSTQGIVPATLDLVIRPNLDLDDGDWGKVPTLESGFPSPRQHFVLPFPELGFTGAVAQSQRLVSCLGGAS